MFSPRLRKRAGDTDYPAYPIFGRKTPIDYRVALLKEEPMLGTVLIVLLILALIGAFPRWGYSRDWGYWPSGGLGLVLAVVVILALLGRI